jgi:hypothetical protein
VSTRRGECSLGAFKDALLRNDREERSRGGKG